MPCESKIEYKYSAKPELNASRRREVNLKKAISAALTVFMAITAAFLILTGLVLRIELTEQNDRNVFLSQRLDELKQENRQLKIKYESAIDLTALEYEAKARLGMKMPDSLRIIQIDPEAQDKATVLSTDGKRDIADKISDLISIISNALL